jgi:hypothetical protein
MARVRVTDEVWAEFRAAAGLQPINLLLGELVERHLQRVRSEQLRHGKLEDADLIEALDRAHELHRDLGAIVTRLEQRLDHQAGSAPGTKSVSPTVSRTRQI